MTEIDQELRALQEAISGEYALEREIGRGGMGVVYLARDLKLDRWVAIKTLPRHLAGVPGTRERFLREARTAASLSHPNIVPVHRADEISGHVFFVMGYVEGESLATRVHNQGRLDPRDVARHLSDVATGLAYAHSHQVIHRDVKAENILLDAASQRAVITDFGIARLAESAPLTATGQMLGTVYYLSPEQISGDPVDRRSDIYSLGVAGYFALSGRFPFDAELASAVLIAHVNKPLPPLRTHAPSVPRDLAAVVERCLSKDPQHRYQTCDELIEELQGAFPAGERMGTPLPEHPAPLVSDTEVHAILHRAAQLDDLTGSHPRPAAVARERDPVSDSARTSGIRLDQLRDAAVEAGIAPLHIEHALVEHGLVRAPKAPTPERARPEVVDLNLGSGATLGLSTKYAYEVVVEGAMPATDLDILVETLGRRTGFRGEAFTFGRTFRWTTSRSMWTRDLFTVPRDIEVDVLAANGTTSICVRESIRSEVVSGLLLTALVALMSGPIAESLLIHVFGLHHGLGPRLTDIWLLLWGGGGVGAFAGMRALLGRLSRKRQAFLRSLTETLGIQARDSAATAAAETPAAPAPRPRLKTSSAG